MTKAHDTLIPLEYAHPSFRRWRRLGFAAAAAAALLVYSLSYLVLRAHIHPAANLAFFAHPVEDEVCYYVFWPAYKLDRLLTSLPKHNRDRAHFVMPEGEAGL